MFGTLRRQLFSSLGRHPADIQCHSRVERGVDTAGSFPAHRYGADALNASAYSRRTLSAAGFCATHHAFPHPFGASLVMYISSIQSYNAVLAGSMKIDEILLRNRNQIATTSSVVCALLSTQLKDVREHLFKPRLRHLQIRTNMVQFGVAEKLLNGLDSVPLGD